MADVREVSIGIEWDINANKLIEADKKTDDIKTKADAMFKSTTKANKQLTTSAEGLSKDFGSLNKTITQTGVQGEKSAKGITRENIKVGESAEEAADSVSEIGNEAQKAEKKAGGLGKVMGGIGKVAIAGFAAAAIAITATGVSAINAGKKQDEYFKTIATGTGATGVELEGLMSSFEKVGSTTDENLGDVASVLSDLSTRTGLAGEPLEELTGAIMDLGDVAKEDFPALSTEGTRMFEAWGIGAADGSDSLDKMLVASQQTGVGVTELMSSMAKFSPQMQAMGFDFNTSAAMMANWERAGLDGNQMLAGLSKASMKFARDNIPVKDGLNKTIEAIQKAGSESAAQSIAVETFGKSGLTMAKAIREGQFEVGELIVALEESQGAIAKTGEATQTTEEKFEQFGNKLHFVLAPLGGELMGIGTGLLDSLSPVLDELVPKISEIFGKIMPVVSSALSKVAPLLTPLITGVEGFFSLFDDPAVGEFFNSIMGSVGELLPPIMELAKTMGNYLKPIITNVFGLMARLVPILLPILKQLIGIVNKVYTAFTPILENILPPLTDLIVNLAGSVLPPLMDAFDKIITAILPPLTQLFNVIITTILPPLMNLINVICTTILPPLMELFTMLVTVLLPPLISLFSNIIGVILPPLINIITAVMSVLAPVIEVITMLLNVILPPLINIISFLANVLTSVLGVAFEQINNVVQMVVGYFQGLMDFITGIFTGDWNRAWDGVVKMFGSIFKGIGDLFKTPINWIIDGINSFLGGLNNIKIPDWVPGVGGMGFSIGQIPKLATGTDNFGGGIAMVGERGRELVNMPKGSQVIPNRRTERIIDAMSVSESGGTSTTNNVININIDARGATNGTVEKIKEVVRNEIPEAIDNVFGIIVNKNVPVT